MVGGNRSFAATQPYLSRRAGSGHSPHCGSFVAKGGQDLVLAPRIGVKRASGSLEGALYLLFAFAFELAIFQNLFAQNT